LGLARKNVYLWRVDAARCLRLRSGALEGLEWPVGSAWSWNYGCSPVTFGRGYLGSRSVGEVKGMSRICIGLTCLGFLGRIILGEKPKEVSLNLENQIIISETSPPRMMLTREIFRRRKNPFCESNGSYWTIGQVRQ
jgi:hypothetical protein